MIATYQKKLQSAYTFQNVSAFLLVITLSGLFFSIIPYPLVALAICNSPWHTIKTKWWRVWMVAALISISHPLFWYISHTQLSISAYGTCNGLEK